MLTPVPSLDLSSVDRLERHSIIFSFAILFDEFQLKNLKKMVGSAESEEHLPAPDSIRITASLIPATWRNQRGEEKGLNITPTPPPLEMHQSYSERLPLLHVTLHSVRGLQTKATHVLVKVRLGQQLVAFKSRKAECSGGAADIGDECLLRVEQSASPFLCGLYVVGAATGALLGAVGVDLQSDLGLQGPPDGRRWAVKLHTGAELLVSFRAHTPFIFPHMAMRNIDGMAATVALPYKPLPELEITIYQAIRLSGVQKLQSYVEVSQRSWDASIGSARTRSLLKTNVFKGYSPFWAESIRFSLQGRDDAILITLCYQKGGKSIKDWQNERICVLQVAELQRVATATESRRWYAFVGKFKGAAVGLGFRACSNMKAIEGLPQGGGEPMSLPRTKVHTKAPSIDELKAMAAAMQREKALNAAAAERANSGEAASPARSTPSPSNRTPGVSTPFHAAAAPAVGPSGPARPFPTARPVVPTTRPPAASSPSSAAAASALARAQTPPQRTPVGSGTPLRFSPNLRPASSTPPTPVMSLADLEADLDSDLAALAVPSPRTKAVDALEADLDNDLELMSSVGTAGLPSIDTSPPKPAAILPQPLYSQRPMPVLSSIRTSSPPPKSASDDVPSLDDLELLANETPPVVSAHVQSLLGALAQADDADGQAQLLRRLTLALPRDDLRARLAELENLRVAEAALIGQLDRLEGAAAQTAYQQLQGEWHRLSVRRGHLLTDGIDLSGSAQSIASGVTLTDEELLGALDPESPYYVPDDLQEPCALCKRLFPPNELRLVRDKSLCPPCKTRVLEQAQLRGIKIE